MRHINPTPNWRKAIIWVAISFDGIANYMVGFCPLVWRWKHMPPGTVLLQNGEIAKRGSDYWAIGPIRLLGPAALVDIEAFKAMTGTAQ